LTTGNLYEDLSSWIGQDEETVIAKPSVERIFHFYILLEPELVASMKSMEDDLKRKSAANKQPWINHDVWSGRIPLRVIGSY
jgi:hypothetical protein